MTHRFPNESASSSSTSMSSQKSETDDDRMIAMVLTEEYAKLDGAMAKRLTNLTSIPHVPRINTYFPTYSDATMDHYRLLDRLNQYGLCEVRVSGDGNCQFRALSDQLYRSPEHHKHVRKEIVKQLKECKSLYEGYVPMKYKHYCKKMKKSGEWGDHVTLQAAADKFAAKICLLTSFRDTCFVEIVPQYQAPQRGEVLCCIMSLSLCTISTFVTLCLDLLQCLTYTLLRQYDHFTFAQHIEIWLSFWSEVHYNSLYDARDLPDKYKPRKKHWILF
ncbi:hypothetical protein EJB05_38196, partial [Eragrostis curvula]